MARMYPPQPATDTGSDAERHLFAEFERQLPASWIVIHGVTWLKRKRQSNFIGEVDFLVIHPRRGLLLLEVKGGRISGDWSASSWTSTNRNGQSFAIKNPVKQVTGALWDLKAKLKESPATSDHTYPIFCGIALPEVVTANQPFGLDWDRSLVLDSADLGDLPAAIERMFSPAAPATPLPLEAITAVVDLLQPTVELTRFGLVAEVQAGEQKMLELSTYQSYALAMLRMHRRAVINGCAGSGKTMLAIEKSIQLAEEGFSVVLTCFNRPLARWMQQVIDQQPEPVRKQIRVSNYHDLAVKLCEEAGHPSQVVANDPHYWNDTLPNHLSDATPFLKTRFDAIVVDEGQDIRDNWWMTLEVLLAAPDDGVLFIFQDPHQAIYRRGINVPVSTPPIELPHNYRTTVTIHERMLMFYPGIPVPLAIGPHGRPVELIPASGAAMTREIRRVLARLIDEEGISPEQIVVLTPSSKARSTLKDGTRLNGTTLSWQASPAPGEIRVSTIHAFKGLEADIVILTETDRLDSMRNGRQLCYVATSRARHHLIVIGDLPAPLFLPTEAG